MTVKLDVPAYLRPRPPAIAARLRPLTDAVRDRDGTIWCGPVALSAITGATATEIEALIARHRVARGEKPGTCKAGTEIVGTSVLDVRPALASLGWRMTCVYPSLGDARTTFGRWMDAPGRAAAAHYLVGLIAARRPHWVALKGVMTADTWSQGRWGFAVDGPHRGARLLDAHRGEREG